MSLTVSKLIEELEGLPADAKVCLVLDAHGRSKTVEWASDVGYADLGDEGEFDDSLTGQYVYIVSGGQRRNDPYLTSEERDELDIVLD